MTGKYPWLVLPDKYKDICRSAVHSYDPLQQDIFTTPWAVHYEDELFFNKTVTLLGDIIKDDVKLGTLFMILILSTPGSCLSAEAQVRIQNKIKTSKKINKKRDNLCLEMSNAIKQT